MNSASTSRPSQPAKIFAETSSAAALVLLAAVSVSLAIACRLPYLTESFWVDELHSAWTVWSDFGDVNRRAALGNQTPVYYWGLWIWRQLVGDAEVGLRMSSVLLSSLAGGVVAVGVARYSGSLAGGLAAGGMMALDPNAIFFGTELRVFAAVMLLAAIACWGWLQCQRTAAGGPAAILVTAVILAGIIQPTSLGVLGWLCISVMSIGGIVRLLRRPAVRQRAGVWSLAAALVVSVSAVLLWWLAGRVLLNAWQHREQWAAFASADSPWEIWTLWRWTVLLLIPAGLATGLALVQRIREAEPGSCPAGLWLRPALVAIGATVFFWLVSAAGIAPVFDRRYQIAVLPILVWAGGSAIGEVDGRIAASSARKRRVHRLRNPWLLLVIGVLAVLVILRLSDARKSPRLRGEAWRAAVAYCSAHRDTAAPVLLSPGLIETRRLLDSGGEAELKYLAYPLNGPYNLNPVRVIALADDPTQSRGWIVEDRSRLAVLRCPRATAQWWAERVVAAGKTPAVAFVIRSFGGVQVVHFDVPEFVQTPE